MNTLHKFAVLTLSAVLTVCLLAGCGASTSSTASSAASSVASSVAASEVASSAGVHRYRCGRQRVQRTAERDRRRKAEHRTG